MKLNRKSQLQDQAKDLHKLLDTKKQIIENCEIRIKDAQEELLKHKEWLS